MKRVVVGLSGGVDSSVAAKLLIDQGYEVIGMFMRNWHDTSVTISDECPWIEDSNDAQLVADALGIPFQVIDLSEEYKTRIVDYMFREYELGRTPNPDVLCNREIKFDIFLKAAMDLGADYVATGHYCRKETMIKDNKEVHRLLAGKDPNKDQSYFLCQLSQAQLAKALFPIGGLLKPEVREIATHAGFVTADKKDSQGLCFIGKVRLPDFLAQQLKPKSGPVIEVPRSMEQFQRVFENKTSYSKDELIEMSKPYYYKIEDGQKMGEHTGAHYFTVGQRKGLGIGGTAEGLFVLHTDTTKNVVYTGQGSEFPGLLRKGLFVPAMDEHWIREDLKLEPGKSQTYLLRIRYRQPLVNGTVFKEENGLYVIFDRPIWGITPGQFVAWYCEDELVGSGVIS
ncbi:MAG: tRNA 2-thiouridine(34) synthase MnmA [Flavobacteriales bacterium]|nr:tRNA 2-thiouridine(34) synthase MnmA [Flavobacteriales bacterium]